MTKPASPEAQAARLRQKFSTLQRSGQLPFPEPAPEQMAQLQKYIALLLEWNQRINLISPNDEERIAERHILESLAVLSAWTFPQKASVLDLGSGGGFPGVPLKIMRPDLTMTLLESRQKKALFLNTVVRELKLENCHVVNARAEKFSGEKFSIVIARAVADLKTLWEWSRPLLIDGGALLAMKGGELDNELHALMKFDSCVKYQVESYLEGWDSEASRCLVVVTETPKSISSAR
jgi:16S rRNA (guanine527-N7)-methyltransferase